MPGVLEVLLDNKPGPQTHQPPSPPPASPPVAAPASISAPPPPVNISGPPPPPVKAAAPLASLKLQIAAAAKQKHRARAAHSANTLWLPPVCPPGLAHAPVVRLDYCVNCTWASAFRRYVSTFSPDDRLLADLAGSDSAVWKYFLPSNHPRAGARRVVAVDCKNNRSHALYALGQKASFAFQVVLSLPLSSAAVSRRVRCVFVLDRERRFESVVDKAGLVTDLSSRLVVLVTKLSHLGLGRAGISNVRASHISNVRQ